ncbi:MAG: hypothetical protein ACI9MR_000009 [Myxococcota bacterium]|jgi:hypothetical protein
MADAPGIMFATKGWLSGSVFVEVVDDDTWTPSQDVLTIREAAVELAAWVADDASRPWSGVTLAWSVVSDGAGRLGILWEPSAAFDDFTCNGTLEGLLGVYEDQGTSEADITTGAYGTLAASQIDTYNWARWSKDEGASAGLGSWVNGINAYAPRRPTVECDLTVGQSYYFTRGMRYVPRAPVRAELYHADSAQWRAVTVGQIGVKESRTGGTFQRLGLEVLG